MNKRIRNFTFFKLKKSTICTMGCREKGVFHFLAIDVSGEVIHDSTNQSLCEKHLNAYREHFSTLLMEYLETTNSYFCRKHAKFFPGITKLMQR